MGNPYIIKGFSYTPRGSVKNGMLQKGIIRISDDGVNWADAGSFSFGSLINDPVVRRYYFNQPVTASFVQIQATEIAGNGKIIAISVLEFFEQ